MVFDFHQFSINKGAIYGSFIDGRNSIDLLELSEIFYVILYMATTYQSSADRSPLIVLLWTEDL